MKYGFNKINNKVLMFDCVKDIEKIRFNHYIMRRENLNRIKMDLPKGQFTMTISTVMKDLNLSKSKSERIIREFENLEIIRSIVKGNLSRGYSIYEYVTGYDENKNTNNFEKDKKIVTNKLENTLFEVFEDNNESEYDKEDKKDFENSKKDNIKIKLNKNNIYVRVIDYLNKKSEKSFKYSTQKTKSCIDARLREGFCEDDFYKVIDIKCSQWLYSEMRKFLRPETLFSNKFEGYLNEVVNNKDLETNMDKNIDKNADEVWDIDFDF